MNIVFLDEKTMGDVPNLHRIKELGHYAGYSVTLPDERIIRAQNADIVITCKVVIDKQVMDACRNLKLICVAATGTNNIDMDYARQKGIVVKNVAGYSTESVAQMTLGMILCLSNRLPYFDQYVKSGQYAKSDMFTHYGPPFYELSGKRAGIIGLGNIGKRVAALLEAFGMEITYFSTSGKNTDSTYKRLQLDELLKTSDVVSVHCPLNDQTRNLIAFPQLQMMKPSAIIVNAGRGGIINEYDLTEALNGNLIAGAGLDVYEREPMIPNHPLLKIHSPEKLVLTPHTAWTSVEARTLLIHKIIQNIKDFQAM
jgi:glycerate dehydrogenase